MNLINFFHTELGDKVVYVKSQKKSRFSKRYYGVVIIIVYFYEIEYLGVFGC